jgi:flavin-dependent dehydrogenase
MSSKVVIIGAGPAGTIAGSLLARNGHRVAIFERERFPRFSIGESLLPQAMVWIEEAGLLGLVEAEDFQPKDGAVFRMGEQHQVIDFRDKTTPGPALTYQVPRDRFDHVLAKGACAAGVEIRFGCRVTSFTPGTDGVSLSILEEDGTEKIVRAGFVLDASGFGRVLARLLDLDRPSDFPTRAALFTHVCAAGRDDRFDRNKILISIHPEIRDIWYWLIPFRNGLASIGAVGPIELLDRQGASDQERLDRLVAASGHMAELLRHAEPRRPIGRITGYARSVTSLTGPGFALLGNAAEFLDPVFSSGITIAMKSASLAAQALDRQLRGAPVDWRTDYETPLKVGIDTFRAYVEAWYDFTLQDIIFGNPGADGSITRMITSVLAGYAWDSQNPFVRDPKRYLSMVQTMTR